MILLIYALHEKITLSHSDIYFTIMRELSNGVVLCPRQDSINYKYKGKSALGCMNLECPKKTTNLGQENWQTFLHLRI